MGVSPLKLDAIMHYHLLLRSEEEIALLKVEMSSVIAFHNHQWNTDYTV